jgi:hypothetical protein
MARGFFINGDTMVSVKGMAGSSIANLTQFGLASDQVRCTPQFYQRPIKVENWGEASPEIQNMLASVRISMNLVHFDRDVLDVCLQMAAANPNQPVGTMARTGTTMGNGLARFAAGNFFVSLNLYSPVAGKPWRFLTAYLDSQPVQFPLGNERSVVNVQWLAVPYPPDGDPWNNGSGASGVVLWDHTLDS